MIGITLIITLGFGLVQFVKGMISDTKNALLSLSAILLLAAVFVVTFITSDNSQPIEILGYEGIHNQGVWLKVVSMFTNTIGIVAGVAILLMLFGGLFRVNK
jgi:sugar phosphate permease